MMIFIAGIRMVGVSGGHAKRERNLKSRRLATFGIKEESPLTMSTPVYIF
jgi:hypothetical protein